MCAYIDEFSWQSVSNIVFEKWVALKRYEDTNNFLEAFLSGIEYRKVKVENMGHLKVIIYSLG